MNRVTRVVDPQIYQIYCQETQKENKIDFFLGNASYNHLSGQHKLVRKMKRVLNQCDKNRIAL